MGDSRVRESIDMLSAGIAADPAKARAKGLAATAKLVDGLRCEISGFGEQPFASDMPSAMGGKSTAPNPGWYLRGAMASCTATVIAMRAAQLGFELSELEVTVDGESDLRGILGMDDKISAGQSAMRMKVKIASPAASPQALREIVAWAEAHSPVSCTVRNAPALSLDVEVV
jgi:uncharacterized OsmC-like protein